LYCSKCGAKIAEDAEFCSSCGSQVEEHIGVSQQAAASVQYRHEDDTKGGKVFIILGWVFFGISLLFVPILFGAGAFIMGYLLRKHNQTHGTILMVMAVAGAILGTLLGMASAGW